MTVSTLHTETTELETAVDELATIEANSQLILSLYLPLDRPHARLMEATREILVRQRTLGRSYSQEVQEMIEKLKAWLEMNTELEGSSLAIFMRAGEFSFETFVLLPEALDLEVNLGHLPVIFPLVQAKDVYHRYAVVFLNQASARIIQVNAGRITKNLLMGSMDLRSKVGREISRDRYNNRQKERGLRFMKEKVQVIHDIIRDNDLDHIILAGDPRLTSKFRELLPSSLVDKVIDQTIDAHHHSFENLLRDSITTFIEAEEIESENTLEQWRHAMATGGLAIAGIQEVTLALDEFRLDRLIISKEATGKTIENLVRKAVVQEVEIETVHETSLDLEHEGIAGFVRYKTQNF